MKRNNGFSRRGFLLGAAAAAGTMALPKFGRHGFRANEAHAQATEKPTLLIIMLRGGYNSIFSSADSFQAKGNFGVTAANIQNLGNGLMVDKPTYGTMPALALSHMAAIGVRHGVSDHPTARTAQFHMGAQSYPVLLAGALGGDAAIKAAVVGAETLDGTHPAAGGVSLQRIADLGSTIAALGGGTDPNIPDRVIAARGLASAKSMSAGRLSASPSSLVTMTDGYDSAIDTLNKPVQTFNYGALTTAYGVAATATAVNNFKMKMVAAELMVLAGANVVVAVDNGWDTHGDNNGAEVRRQMNADILPGLNVFLGRTLAMTGRNVVTLITGDFARSLPGSNHQPNLTSTVIGKYVKVGTTGKTDDDAALKAGTPSYPGLWAYLTQVLKVGSSPFGANPHPLVL